MLLTFLPSGDTILYDNTCTVFTVTKGILFTMSADFKEYADLIDEMTEKGFISAFEGNRTRKVLMTYDEFVEKYENGEQ